MPTAPASVIDRVIELRSEIARHNELYYRDATPEITDQEYDALLRELIGLEARYKDVLSDLSPTQYVGNDLTGGFPEVEHKVKMLSINNAFDEEELDKFLKRVSNGVHGSPHGAVRYTVESKIDGAAVTLFYDGGFLRYAATRGNGSKGEVITENILTSDDVPRAIPFKGVLEIRGEAYISRKDFAIINAERVENGDEPFANPRNACAGSLKLKDPREVAKRRIRFVAHGHGITDLVAESWSGMIDAMRDATGHQIPFNATLPAGSKKEVLELIERIDQSRLNFPWEIDGAVVKVDDIRMRTQLGSGNKAPHWVVAYKYATEQARAKVKDIIWQVGRTGAVTPVCIIEPTPLCGTTVQRATLHNAEWFAKFLICHGDTVVVQKAGEIIPQVLECIHTGGMVEYRIPTTCPSCGEPLIFEQDGRGPGLLCTNPDCADQLAGRIQHFCSRDRMDIEGFGDKVCEQLVEKGLVRRLPDLYALTVESLCTLPRMGEKTAQKLLDNLRSQMNPDLAIFISSLGIPEVGRTVSREFARHFKTLDAIRAATREQMEVIDGVGSAISAAAYGFFNSERGQRLIDDLLAFGIVVEEGSKEVGERDDRFFGKKFVITGTLHIGRKEAQTFIEARGGVCSNSVSKKTDIVIIGEDPGSKADKAMKLGLEIWDTERFANIHADLTS